MKNLIYLFAMLVAFGCQKAETDLATDNGNKWQVNSEMAKHVDAIEADIANFKTGEDIAMLQTKLKANISELTAKCTMQGQAHDELHKWLMPFIETVNTMHAQDPKAAIENLSGQMENYHLYFESATQGI